MNPLQKLLFRFEQRPRRRRLVRQHGEEHVAALDAFSQTVSTFLKEDPHLQPLATAIMGLTGSGEELWGRKRKEFGSLSDAPLDLAFRTTACVLASRLGPGDPSPDSFSLTQVVETIHMLWSRSPTAGSPMTATQIADLMRIASTILMEDPTVQPFPLHELGELVVGDDLFAGLFVAQLVPALAADTYHTIPFTIRDSTEDV